MTFGFLLDTNVASEFAKPAPNPRVVAWIEARNEHHLSVITIGELRKGFSLLPESKRRIHLQQWFQSFLIPLAAGRILPVTQIIGERWGVLSARRQLQGSPLSMADGLIAATALEHNLTLVTRNVKDFAALGVTILNPWEPN